MTHKDGEANGERGQPSAAWLRNLPILTAGGFRCRVPRSTMKSDGMWQLANEFARDNILVNALLTGSIVIDQVASRHQWEQPSNSFEDYSATTGKGISIGRMNAAQEYAYLTCFLASDACSYVTGTAINLDGGACIVV